MPEQDLLGLARISTLIFLVQIFQEVKLLKLADTGL